MIDTNRLNEIDFYELDCYFDELSDCIAHDDLEYAKEILPQIKEEVSGIYKEDNNERYFCFDNPLQYYIYEYKLPLKKYIKRSEIDYRTLHLCHAHILAEDGLYEQAEEELKEALYWNPVDCEIFFALAKLYLLTKELKKLLIVLKAVRSYIIDRTTLAKYYGYIGEYYLKKGDLETALSMFKISEETEKTSISKNGTEKILNTTKTVSEKTASEVIETLKKDDLPYGPDVDILSLIYGISNKMQVNLNYKEAAYCLNILYKLTLDEKYLREMELLT